MFKFFLLIFISLNLFSDMVYDAYVEANKGNYQKAAKIYQKSCDTNDTRGCFNLALMYDSAQGVKKDTNKSRGLYKKSDI